MQINSSSKIFQIIAQYQTAMKVGTYRRWSTFLLLFWGLQTMAVPVPTGNSRNTDSASRPAAQQHYAASLLSSTSTLAVQQQRMNRKVADLDLTSGPIEYMKQLRSSLTNEDGSPTMEREDDPTTVWGLVDKG